MIAIGLLEIMRKGRRVPECIRLIGNINVRTALSKPYRIAPPPYHIAPRQSLGQSGSGLLPTLSHGDNTPKPTI